MHDIDFMVDEMKLAKSQGVSCIVDGGHPDMGRDINFLRQLSQQSGLPIVAGAGFYTQPFYPQQVARLSEDQLVRELIRQVERVSRRRVRRDRVLGRDHRRGAQGVPRRGQGACRHQSLDLHAHRHSGKIGAGTARFVLEDVGVDPKKVVIGHVGNLVDPNVEVHRAICRRGAFMASIARAARATPSRCRWS
ncbi:MAG: hypothetical protein QM736_04890 [Vicinamibacterales bacterium]